MLSDVQEQEGQPTQAFKDQAWTGLGNHGCRLELDYIETWYDRVGGYFASDHASIGLQKDEWIHFELEDNTNEHFVKLVQHCRRARNEESIALSRWLRALHRLDLTDSTAYLVSHRERTKLDGLLSLTIKRYKELHDFVLVCNKCKLRARYPRT